MSTDAFEKTNWVWEFSLFQQKVGEWVEYQFSQFQTILPELPSEWSISPWVGKLLEILFWSGLGSFLLWIGWRLWQEFNPYIYAWLNTISNYSSSRKNVDSREISIALLLKQSQEFNRQDNYTEACRCIYLAMLQQLHEQAIALEKPSRTNGEYLHLLKSSVTLIQPYQILITTHEKLCFSNYKILAENYQQCWQAYQQIQRISSG
ncbi:DUF4129 domain-containing protein [Aphanizomenon flos-aquae NRERC-008]|uniref:DUF4129 domain-containing protein n=1 Tax=Aphanizomenon flos-aquae FACHB-1249 TaxID=2692889 RepID=A0ABR8ITX9_APHFL|nr:MULTISPECIES: DUF4129 domain-containing protein [Aphanizomenon]MBD2390663.1 DUF4129 domain-containing protein [Aphanizomenon flos-aquae FACHB-1171]MBD2557638.1 DUF4129 domain-containing protein [Aphanizomenon flos-aquae FACHB-1290]MBD2632075.1 DUF4129 domain-containing protein [Aphanizomenon sp. FACHB-1399]MBD2642814.1 DUF4129 domain-containing protein [Aphanizomenon sp. FACHB-1401]MBD2657405.1 DUF4129 domain-containing protein [Aphanizomenon flos-aquae FACHB-1265]